MLQRLQNFHLFSIFVQHCGNTQKSLFYIAFILGHDQLSIINLSLASILVGSKKNPGVIGRGGRGYKRIVGEGVI